MDRLAIYNEHITVMLAMLEDDEDFRNLFESYLHERGIKNIIVANVDEFLQKITPDVHICVIDHFIGQGRVGLEVLEKILAINKYAYVIVVSLQQDIEVAAKYVNMGAWKYITKQRKTDLQVMEEVKGWVEVALQEIGSEVMFFSSIQAKLNEAKKQLVTSTETLNQSMQSDDNNRRADTE